MSGNTTGNADQIKGRVKEAVGALTNDQKLKNEGKIDQAAGKIKNAVDKTKEALTGKK